jgi:hypothetical protein
MRPFHPNAAAAAGRFPLLESVNQTGSVKIVDTFAMAGCSPYSLAGLKPLNEQSNLASTGV